MSKIKNLIGDKFGRLLVIAQSEGRSTNGGGLMWVCQCDCGEKKTISSRGLVHDGIESCGCKRREKSNVNKISIGMRVGKLTVVGKRSKISYVTKWDCLCDCGKSCIVESADIVRAHVKSCGCSKYTKKIVDMVGCRFSKLVVVKMCDKRNSFNEILWECLCDCGNTKLSTTGSLNNGGNKSCGCLSGNPTHGDSSKRIRHIWSGMMARCYSKTATSYFRYGAKGISVCDEWHDYDLFKRWAFDNGYTELLTLDRFPNQQGNYSPNNCRWATSKQQGNNKSSNRFVDFNGETKTISEWADIYGINQLRIRKRLELGWSAEDAITKQIISKYRNRKYDNRPS